MIRRAIIIVLDSLGVGEMPDAAKYGDQGADTLGHILDHCPQLQIPNLQKMGMGNIKDAAGGRLKVAHPEGVYGRFMEHSTGKDTTGRSQVSIRRNRSKRILMVFHRN